jgi:ABC-type multidrug transport system fused ATPase/permease subunit
VLALASLQAGLTFAYIALLSAVGDQLCERMRCALFSAMLRQDVVFFDRRKSGELMDRLTADVDAFRSAFKQVVSQGLKDFTQAAGSVVAMFFVSRELALGVSLLVPAIVAGGTLFGSALRSLSREAKAATAEAHGVAGEVLNNVRTVKSFAAEELEEVGNKYPPPPPHTHTHTRARAHTTEQACRSRIGCRCVGAAAVVAGLLDVQDTPVILHGCYPREIPKFKLFTCSVGFFYGSRVFDARIQTHTHTYTLAFAYMLTHQPYHIAISRVLPGEV